MKHKEKRWYDVPENYIDTANIGVGYIFGTLFKIMIFPFWCLGKLVKTIGWR